ncbi:hypothetical protein [Trichococcus alkaliphilus]|uniref:hypothetical protein n=1 Tax=Trichococcus alkaliphilus TaxID=2052943 RepID=UPI000D0BADAF|nr:hypothetical protein [Trichococcus alkaliphilus]
MKRIFKVFGVLVASIFIIAIFQLISPVLLVLSGYGIWYYMKKTPNPKRMKLAIVGTVISLFGTFALMTSGGENSASETTAKQSQTESSTKEKTQKELAEEEKAKAESEQEKLLKSASAAINVADIWPSRSNFTTASKAFDEVEEPTDDLQNKLKSVEEKVVREEENIQLAEEAIASAEANLTSESIQNAKTYLAVVVTRQKDFTDRIVNVERTIEEQAAQAESARIAAEESARIAAEESARIAAEESARIAAEESARIAAEESAASNNPSTVPFSGNGDVTTNDPAQGTMTVYWTPGGKSYHYDRNCYTLARSTTILEGPASNCPKTDPCNVCVY